MKVINKNLEGYYIEVNEDKDKSYDKEISILKLLQNLNNFPDRGVLS